MRNCASPCSTICGNRQTRICGDAEDRKYRNVEGDLLLPVPLICAGYLAGQASDRWNRSILPMQSIGKTPVNLDCLVCLAKLPGCHVGETCVSACSWKAVACRWQQGMAGCAIPSARSRSCRANPRPPMAVVALSKWGQCSRKPADTGVRSLLLFSVAGRDVDGWDSRPGDEVAYPLGSLSFLELADQPGAGQLIRVLVVPNLTDDDPAVGLAFGNGIAEMARRLVPKSGVNEISITVGPPELGLAGGCCGFGVCHEFTPSVG